MPNPRSTKATGPRELTLLVVARVDATHLEIAGIDGSTGAWLRAAQPTGGRAFTPDALRVADGTHAVDLDMIRVAAATPAPAPPFVENSVFDLATPPVRTGHIEERAISRTLAAVAVPHLDTLLPAGKRVLMPKDLLPGGRQRSIAMLRPDQIQHIHFSYEGEDVRVGVSFRHRGQAYGGPTGLPCPDIKVRAFARDALRSQGSLAITLDGRACYNRFACARIYLTVGLIEGTGGMYWPQVLGFHPIREYRATIDYDRL